jgi:hypothetical protein
MSKIPADAFDFYVSLGPGRSYRAVASRYGVGKRAVTKHAATENWIGRLAKIEEEVREKSEKKLVETLEEMRTRHLQMVRAMQARALVALKSFPLTSGMEAIKAGELSIKLERLLAGEASERTAINIEAITRREIETLLVADDDEEDEPPEAGGSAQREPAKQEVVTEDDHDEKQPAVEGDAAHASSGDEESEE